MVNVSYIVHSESKARLDLGIPLLHVLIIIFPELQDSNFLFLQVHGTLRHTTQVSRLYIHHSKYREDVILQARGL